MVVYLKAHRLHKVRSLASLPRSKLMVGDRNSWSGITLPTRCRERSARGCRREWWDSICLKRLRRMRCLRWRVLEQRRWRRRGLSWRRGRGACRACSRMNRCTWAREGVAGASASFGTLEAALPLLKDSRGWLSSAVAALRASREATISRLGFLENIAREDLPPFVRSSSPPANSDRTPASLASTDALLPAFMSLARSCMFRPTPIRPTLPAKHQTAHRHPLRLHPYEPHRPPPHSHREPRYGSRKGRRGKRLMRDESGRRAKGNGRDG